MQLNPNQFRSEQYQAHQGNPDELVQHRGVQNLTSNVYGLPFSNVPSEVTANPSAARASRREEDD